MQDPGTVCACQGNGHGFAGHYRSWIYVPVSYTHLGQEIAVARASSLQDAVAIARSMASPGDSVVLSPACASYDMFSNFEERGRLFKAIVYSLNRT